jgi:lipid A oxidase
MMLAAIFIMGSPSARGEFVISFYSGKAITDDGDLNLTQPGGTDMTFHNVSWSDKSFESPFNYGARITYWCDKALHWGAALDYEHIKIYADPNQTVSVSGTTGGVPATSPDLIGNTFSDFNFSHGLNFITLNLLYRWFPTGQRDKTFLGRLQPYVGLGAGITIPHTEVTTAVGGIVTSKYEFGGPAVQGLMGLNFDLFKHLSTFIEYKLSYADVDADITGGGKVATEAVTHHLVFGISVPF